jgi:hypothetical protein
MMDGLISPVMAQRFITDLIEVLRNININLERCAAALEGYVEEADEDE